jgi:zinc and cadmium transporter
MLPLAVGVFIGVVFFELIPETLAHSGTWGPLAIVVGFLGFYALSHIIRAYHHHHDSDCNGCLDRGSAKLLLIGDAVHNFTDGIVIAAAFAINPAVGILATIGIALHEIPQEIAEFSVLVQSGYSRTRALAYNFLSASSVILGTVVAYLFAQSFEAFAFILTGIAAGNLLYIAAADLIPELRESHKEHFLRSFAVTLLGVFLIAGIIHYAHERFMPEHAHTHGEELHHEEAHHDAEHSHEGTHEEHHTH